MHPAILAILLSVGGAAVIGGTVLGGLYLGVRSKGFAVPQGNPPVDRLLNFQKPLDLRATSSDIQPMKELEGVAVENVVEAKVRVLKVDGQTVAVGAMRFSSDDAAWEFWRRYFRSIASRHVRQGAFRNNMFRPFFVTGRYGLGAKEDIAAWTEGRWFFCVSASTALPDFKQVRVSVTEAFLNHMKQIDSKALRP